MWKQRSVSVTMYHVMIATHVPLRPILSYLPIRTVLPLDIQCGVFCRDDRLMCILQYLSGWKIWCLQTILADFLVLSYPHFFKVLGKLDLLMSSYETQWGKTSAIRGLSLETPSFCDYVNCFLKGRRSLEGVHSLFHVILWVVLKLFKVSKCPKGLPRDLLEGNKKEHVLRCKFTYRHVNIRTNRSEVSTSCHTYPPFCVTAETSRRCRGRCKRLTCVQVKEGISILTCHLMTIHARLWTSNPNIEKFYSSQGTMK